jgi:hypothetical protein
LSGRGVAGRQLAARERIQLADRKCADVAIPELGDEVAFDDHAVMPCRVEPVPRRAAATCLLTLACPDGRQRAAAVGSRWVARCACSVLD